jgi:Na+/H+ antiporter NhaD/arsenite permease-like protein
VNDRTVWLTWAIFAATYAGLALGKVPGLRVDRAGIALIGATLMLVTRVLTLEQSVSAESIDFKTLLLLFGMMIVVGALRLSGFFERLAGLTLRRIATPKGLLAATIGLAGMLSAFLINDVVCVALTPLVLHLARRLRFDPLPHLIGLATAANVGSTGTITGNPQNIYIGAHSGISYLRFASRLLPVALLGLGLTYLVVCLVYRARLAPPQGTRNARHKRQAPKESRGWSAAQSSSRSPASKIGGRDGGGGGTVFHGPAAGVGCQSDRRGERAPRRDDDRVLGILQSRHSAYSLNTSTGYRLAGVRAVLKQKSGDTCCRREIR